VLPSVGIALNDNPILRRNKNKYYEPGKQDISDPFPVYLGPRIGHKYHDHKRNKEILGEMKAELVEEKLRRYKSNSLRHVTRTRTNRMPKIVLDEDDLEDL
jgi:hypothetical protein